MSTAFFPRLFFGKKKAAKSRGAVFPASDSATDAQATSSRPASKRSPDAAGAAAAHKTPPRATPPGEAPPPAAQYWADMEAQVRQSYARVRTDSNVSRLRMTPSPSNCSLGNSTASLGDRPSVSGRFSEPTPFMLKALETIQKRDSFAAAAAGAGAATTAPAPAKKPVLSKVQNSTGTIFLDHTLAEPDVAVALECVSRVLHAHIASDDAPVDNPAFDVFEDASGLLLDVEPEGPGLETVVAFVDHIYYSAQLYVECIVTTLILVERLLQHNEDSLRLSRSNWQAVIFTTMMLSSKLCDDESPKNADWRYVWSHFNLARINELEAGLLNALAFQVSVSASQYAMHYFHLRTIARRLGLAKAEAIMPVDVRVADRIAATSHKFCVLKSPALKKKSLVSAKSCSARTFADKTHEPKCPHATLEQLVDMTHGAAADEMALAHRRSRSSFNDHPSDQAVR